MSGPMGRLRPNAPLQAAGGAGVDPWMSSAAESGVHHRDLRNCDPRRPRHPAGRGAPSVGMDDQFLTTNVASIFQPCLDVSTIFMCQM